MKNASLRDKISCEEYVDKLSEPRRKELLFCNIMLTDEEMNYFSSIDTAYKLARRRYTEDILSKSNKDMADKILSGKRVPIINIFDSLGEDNEQGSV